MLKNYIKIAWRNLVKNKIDSIISIGGMAVGIACCILLVLFIHFEWSFDTFHEKGDRIFRVVTEETDPYGEQSLGAQAPPVMASELESRYPGVQRTVRIGQWQEHIEVGQNKVIEEVLFADPGFFNMFSFPLIQGSANHALARSGNIVISRQKALQFFDTADAVGKIITVRFREGDRSYRVSGVAENPPDNSSIDFEYVLPFEEMQYNLPESARKYFRQNWNHTSGEIFVLLNRQVQEAQVEQQFPKLAEDFFAEEQSTFQFELQPLEEIYLSPDVASRITSQSSTLYSWVLGGIAFIVLVIACLNFMSLTLSRASARAGEIGIRKVAGAQRSQLHSQFFGEALLTCAISFAIGVIIAEISLPYFREIAQKPIPFNLFSSSVLWLVMGGLVLLSALIAGGYPALILSGKKAVETLDSRALSARIPGFVKGLVVAQFALSITFVAAAFIMHEQLQYITSKDLGFDKENVVLVSPSPNAQEGDPYPVFVQEVRRLSAVEETSFTLDRYGSKMSAHLNINSSQTEEVALNVIDEHFLQMMEIELSEGRNFSESRPSDWRNSVLVNRAFVEMIGWDKPIGKEIPEVDEEETNFIVPAVLKGKKVIGVVENYHYRSLYNSLGPQILVHKSLLGSSVGGLWIKIADGRVTETLASLKDLWEKVGLEGPLLYQFLDDQIQQFYENERRWRETVMLASGFAILLACFGLFGLAALTARRRTKEIGIRKVLGATLANIVGLLSKDFMKLVLLGFLIAVPVAWYAMHRWLQEFAYKIDITPGTFLLAGGVAVFIALATVSWQSVRAALANPVESLRNE